LYRIFVLVANATFGATTITAEPL